jgi:hypothetical protein
MKKTRSTRRRGAGLTVVTSLAFLVLLGACGGGGGGSDVATLGGDSASASNDDSSGSGDGGELTDAERQDAFRKFAQCMREHGIDMPDPQFESGPDGGGGVIIQGEAAAGSEEQDPEKFEAADKACQKHLEGVIDERRAELDPEEEERMKQRALAFAQCMRDHDIDFPDPQFGEGGRITQKIGPGEIDPNDPKFQEAQEECADETGMPGPGARRFADGGPSKDSQ